jgi:hypothetical protein
MYKYQALRKCISNNDSELIIYGADSFSQFPRRDASVHSKCDRALPIARHDDLVVLRGDLDQEYHKWLRSHGLGSDNIVEYKVHSPEMTLSELIINDPEPVNKIIRKLGKIPVYVPWFSGHMEAEAAKVLGADLFGATEVGTLTYNDKSAFKTLCRQLDIPVVRGSSFDMHPEDTNNCTEMENVIKSYLSNCETVIIRGTIGEAGVSLYKTKGNDVSKIYHEIAITGEKTVIIEPFLNVSSSPNDQWVISRNGTINSLGMRDQICERGMVHVGTLKGAKTPPDISNYIIKTSATIVNNMFELGYQGVVGIDYIVSNDGIFPVENNARFNGSSYVNMIVDNIEELTSPIPCWKFMKIKTEVCSFSKLTERIGSVLYDGKKSNSVFPFCCDSLPISGDFAVIILAENMDEINNMEESLKEMGVKRD